MPQNQSTQTRPTSGIPESPEATTTGDIAAGQQPVEPERGIGVGQPAPQGIVAPTGEPVGTSNRIFEQTYGEGVIPSGIGADTGQLLDNARIGIRDGSIDPYFLS